MSRRGEETSCSRKKSPCTRGMRRGSSCRKLAAQVGAGGHVFPRRIFFGMRRGHGLVATGPCSSSMPMSANAAVVSPQPGSIVTVLVSEDVFRSRYGGGLTAFRGFGATPPRHHGIPFARALIPLDLFCVAHRVCHSTWRQAVWVMWVPRVIPRFRIFRACTQPGLVPFCVYRAICYSTPCLSPVGRLGLRLGRGLWLRNSQEPKGIPKKTPPPSRALSHLHLHEDD